MRHSVVSVVFLCLLISGAVPLNAQDSPGDPDPYKRATQAFQQENYQQSLDLYQRFIRNNPNDPRFWDAKFGEAQSHFKLNHFDQANETFATVRKNHSDKTVRGDALFGQIQVAILQDNVALARTLSETFLDIHSNHILRSSVKRQLELMDDTETRTEVTGTSDSPVSDREEAPDQRSEDTETQNAGTMDRTGSDQPEREESEEPMLPTLRFGSSSDTTPRTQSDDEDQSSNRAEPSDDTGSSEQVELIRSLRDRLNKRSRTIDQLRSRLDELRGENNELDSRVQSLSETNRRLKNQLSRKIANLASDTELHRLSRSVELPDTANQVLQASLSDLRRQAQSALESNRLERANEQINNVLERNPRPSDHYLSAQIAREMGQMDRAIDQLSRAIELSDSPPVSYLAEKAELLFERGDRESLARFIRQHSDTVQSRSETSATSRWYLLLGRRDLRKNRPDQAFFHLMRAIRTAPESTWAEQARTLVQNEL